jgi:uncharacterized membrane protein
MKNFIEKSALCLLFLLLSLTAFAQGADEVEMADRLRADGKIWVVVTIVLIVLTGFIVYLITIDRKIKKLEKMVSEKNPGK